MKRVLLTTILVAMLLSLMACDHMSVTRTYEASEEGILKTYYEMSDGSWKCEDHAYSYRLEIQGRMNNADSDLIFVYLSNEPDISFEKAWMAAGLSSNSDDYFPLEEAVCVEMKSIK